jgi:hypothetical protein
MRFFGLKNSVAQMSMIARRLQVSREVIDVCELADLGYKGIDWMFEKRIVGGDFCKVRLDMALAAPSWSSMFPFSSVEHLTAAKSDHSLIVLINDLEASNL